VVATSRRATTAAVSAKQLIVAETDDHLAVLPAALRKYKIQEAALLARFLPLEQPLNVFRRGYRRPHQRKAQAGTRSSGCAMSRADKTDERRMLDLERAAPPAIAARSSRGALVVLGLCCSTATRSSGESQTIRGPWLEDAIENGSVGSVLAQ
jgi:hypothetical protein